ncbi:MAG: murein L,D-transpeptidase [Desulfobulbaceae bacterium]
MLPLTPILHCLAACLFSLSFAVSVHAEVNIPRSEISRAAYQRLAPLLDQEMRKKGLHLGQPIFIRIFKEENELEVWVKRELAYELFETYSICKYSGDLGPKLREGDEQSPEGFYTVTVTALNPWSNFHLSFNLGYPNEYDRLHKRTGNALMVHGKCTSVGCFAMNDFRIEEIYTIVDAALSNGQEEFSVHIFPFRMTWDKMAKNAESQWVPFWENLKQGYDFFQGHRTPPMVTVEEQQYAFHTSRPLLFGGDLTPVKAVRTEDEQKVAEIRIKPANEKRYFAGGKKTAKNRSAL